MIKLTFLGTGAAIPSEHHNNACLLVEESSEVLNAGDLAQAGESNLLLIEAGPNVMGQLARLKIDILNLNNVVLSHGHGDHILGFPMLVIAWFVLGRQAPVQVYGPEGIGQTLQTITLACYPEVKNYYGQIITVHELPVDSRSETAIDGFCRLRTAPAQHSVPALALRFDFPHEDCSITFSGDTMPTPALVDLAQDTDLLIHDATYSERLEPGRSYPVHTTARASGRIATEARAKSLALVHLSPGYDGLEDVVRSEAAENFSGNILAPLDLDTIELG